MYGPGSSKKMESAGLIGSCLFLNMHTATGKKGRCRHSPILKYHCLPMVHSNVVAPSRFFSHSVIHYFLNFFFLDISISFFLGERREGVGREENITYRNNPI